MRTRALTLTALAAAAVLALSGCGPEDPLRVGVDTVEIDVVYGNHSSSEGDSPEPGAPDAGDPNADAESGPAEEAP